VGRKPKATNLCNFKRECEMEQRKLAEIYKYLQYQYLKRTISTKNMPATDTNEAREAGEKVKMP
jgi:hypothetical protein